MAMMGKSRPVRPRAFSLSWANRTSKPATSPARIECLDIFSPAPGDKDVISQIDRLSSKDTKIAGRSVWIAVDASVRSAATCMVVSRVGGLATSLCRARRSLSRRPWDLACAEAFCTGTGRSPSPSPPVVAGTLSGRPEAVADDECDGEVGPARSSEEASEQGGLGCCGARGAQGRGQGECGTAKHGPDAEPGSRVTRAGPHTRSRHQEQAGQADGASASPQHRRFAGEFLRTEEDRSAGRRRDDVDRICEAPGGEPPGPACSRPYRSVSSAAVTSEVYTEGG